MAIKGRVNPEQESAYIASATDALGVKERKIVAKGNKGQISVALDLELLEQVNAKADELAISRAALVSIALKHFFKTWQG
jgi:hypothetical protein